MNLKISAVEAPNRLNRICGRFFSDLFFLSFFFCFSLLWLLYFDICDRSSWLFVSFWAYVELLHI